MDHILQGTAYSSCGAPLAIDYFALYVEKARECMAQNSSLKNQMIKGVP